MRPGCLLPCFVSLCALLRFHTTSPRNISGPKTASSSSFR